MPSFGISLTEPLGLLKQTKNELFSRVVTSLRRRLSDTSDMLAELKRLTSLFEQTSPAYDGLCAAVLICFIVCLFEQR
jgi:hypothetical protein